MLLPPQIQTYTPSVQFHLDWQQFLLSAEGQSLSVTFELSDEVLASAPQSTIQEKNKITRGVS